MVEPRQVFSLEITGISSSASSTQSNTGKGLERLEEHPLHFQVSERVGTEGTGDLVTNQEIQFLLESCMSQFNGKFLARC